MRADAAASERFGTAAADTAESDNGNAGVLQFLHRVIAQKRAGAVECVLHISKLLCKRNR